MNCSRLKGYIFDLTKLFMFFQLQPKVDQKSTHPSSLYSIFLYTPYKCRYKAREVSGHVFVCQRSCICVLEVMYLCVRGHVFVCQRSCICVNGHVFVCQRSCICVLAVMYLCVRGHVFVCQRSCIRVLGYRFDLFLRFVYWILDLFRQCGIFFFLIVLLWLPRKDDNLLSMHDFFYLPDKQFGF